MNSLQEKILNILIWFDDFCFKNNIRYYLIGGTELGAIRHGGFIPWDDDADVGIPRDDYQRFIELTKNQLFWNKYFVESPYYSEEDYFYPFCKIFDIQTTLIEKTRDNFVRGVYIDVFPLDGMGDSYDKAKRFFKKCYKKNLRASLSMTGIRVGRKWYKNFAVKLSHLFIKPSTKRLIKNDAFCKKFDFEKSKFIGNIHGAWGFKETVKKSVFGKGKTVSFEGHLFTSVNNSDEYLRSLYGDYMVLPPIEKQKSHHDYIYLDVNNSFVDNPMYNGRWKKERIK